MDNDFVCGMLVGFLLTILISLTCFMELQYNRTLREIRPYATEGLECDSDMNKMTEEQFKFCKHYRNLR